MDIKTSRELSLGVVCCANKYQISDGAIDAFGNNDCRYFTVTDCDGNKRLYLKGDVHLVVNGLPAKCNTNQPTRSNATPQVEESITIFGESYSDFTSRNENETPLVLFPAAGQTLEQLNAALQQILRSCCCNETPLPPGPQEIVYRYQTETVAQTVTAIDEPLKAATAIVASANTTVSVSTVGASVGTGCVITVAKKGVYRIHVGTRVDSNAGIALASGATTGAMAIIPNTEATQKFPVDTFGYIGATFLVSLLANDNVAIIARGSAPATATYSNVDFIVELVKEV